MKNLYSQCKTGIAFTLLLLLGITNSAESQTWTNTHTSLPVPAGGYNGSAAFELNGKIYIGGGCTPTGNGFFQFDTASNSWTQKADLPTTSGTWASDFWRLYPVGFSINGKGYVGLGDIADAGGLRKDLWEYDPAANTWTQKADFPGTPREGSFAFVINNIAYVGCGEDVSGSAPVGDMYAYDPSTNTWTAKASYPTGGGVMYASAVVVNNKAYIICGSQDFISETKEVYQYDPSTDKWSAMASFPSTALKRQAGVAFALNNKIYYGLGQDGYNNAYSDFFVYDPVANNWSSAGNFAGPARAWASAVVLNGKAYVGGGSDFATPQPNFYKDLWKYTPAASTSGGTLVNSVSKGVDDLVCYPVPSTGIIHLSSSTSSNFAFNHFTLLNIMGEKVSSGNVSSGSTIDLSDLSVGQYTLAIQTGQQVLHTKISIQR